MRGCVIEMAEMEGLTHTARACAAHLRHLVATIPRRSQDIHVDDCLTLVNDFFETFASLREEEERISASLRLTPMWRSHLGESDDLHRTILRALPSWQRDVLVRQPFAFVESWRRVTPQILTFLETCDALYVIVDRLFAHQRSREPAGIA